MKAQEMRKAVFSYEQWAANSGVHAELATKYLIADELLLSIEPVYEAISTQMSAAIRKVLADRGFRAGEMVVWKEREMSLRATEFGVSLDVIQGDHPLEYLSMAHRAWLDANVEVERWERMSLWGYIRYWIRRTKQHYIPKGDRNDES